MFITEIPERSLYAWFEAEALNRVILNLLANTLKYNPPGTRLRVELKEREDHILIDIADTGIGIPEHLRRTIFNPFVRVDESRSGERGTGLGLSIARLLMEKMNGTIELYETSREATVFTLRLSKINEGLHD
ncbi:sensor histidine kinase [Paenibacillus sp. UNC451MF]|uniref:sensor histidine kinase n=1 Tax=Paenibacillus sp. UNC451MF TaxID=1449063 RepID=UPI00048C8B0C|nr:ATP-binding protein [Paenibacillus sp. UNC451MF]